MLRTPVLVLLAVCLGACTAAQRRNTEKTVAGALINDQQEFELGFQVHEQLKKDNTKFLTNPKVELYVEQLVKKLAAQANKERAVQWRTYVVDDPATINAFATPGGRIYVYTGLLLSADNEAEVVGVMGHEMGHVVARHGARQLVAAFGLETVVNMALGKDAGDVAKLSAMLAGKAGQLAYGRDMEHEADEYGARYSSSAGYDPRGLASFFEKLKAKHGDTGPVMTFFSTHPANSDRINEVTKLIAAENLTGAELGVASLQAVKAELGNK